jgi:hypothetical protein
MDSSVSNRVSFPIGLLLAALSYAFSVKSNLARILLGLSWGSKYCTC